jgi:ABC-type branched-subunit amino acid transport system permease subunit
MIMENREINWYSTGVIERIFDFIAGKRLGRRAYTYFTIIVSVIALVVFISANIWSRQVEKSMKQQSKAQQQQHMKSD